MTEFTETNGDCRGMFPFPGAPSLNELPRIQFLDTVVRENDYQQYIPTDSQNVYLNSVSKVTMQPKQQVNAATTLDHYVPTPGNRFDMAVGVVLFLLAL